MRKAVLSIAKSMRGFTRLKRIHAPLLVSIGVALSGPLAASVHADSGFERWKRQFWPTASASGVTSATYNAALGGITPDPDTIRLMNKQAEFVKPVWEYLESAVSEKRMETGRRMLAEYSEELGRIERRFGVDREVVLAIWGMETNYGGFKGEHYVIRALATLAYAAPRRTAFWEQELVTALQILQAGHVTPQSMEGSWAGAMGHTQFMPSSWRRYSADYDGDGRHDIWTSVPDALASTANYLKQHGWQHGKTWGYEVDLPRGFDYSLADGDTTKTLADWRRLGIRRTGDRAFPRPDDRAELLLPAGAGGPAFLMLKNFFVIKRYNNADAYALAVGHLADRIRGGDAFQAAWPRNALPLSREQTMMLQTLLNRKGFDVGEADGLVGPATKRGIRAYQRAAGLTPDGYASVLLLQSIQSGS